ncbi:uncharacterized protein HRG_11861 [Hirsutella rhossiliensis]|uniref:Uncharacterized protein n=1 Tax=Hirsutella rhossiliensis TaxID=111463 RepID=A0A9P8SC11_9HYPO|nr:uncharacterized protein HRG_11861 [Hirsutella rhossiliensis]KAH0957061.1 hypothetical protein HRG_11861 [Hirsutella rhossiliensis]
MRSPCIALLALPFALVAALEPSLDLEVSNDLDDETPLKPIPQPDKNLMDLKNIEPKHDIAMLWKQDETGSVNVASQMSLPTVLLEDIGTIESVVCDANSIKVIFKDNTARPREGIYRADGVTANQESKTFEIAVQKTDFKETTEDTDITVDSITMPGLSRRAEFSKKFETSYDMEHSKELFNYKNVSLVADHLHIEAGVTFSGKIKMKWFSVTECWFDMSGHAALDLGLQLQLMAQFQETISKSTSPLTFPLLAVPGIITVGPAVQFGVGMDIAAIAALTAEANVKLDFPNAQWHVDLVDGEKSKSEGFTPNTEANVKLGGRASLLMDPFIDFRFMLNAQLFMGLANINGGVGIKPKIANTVTVDASKEVFNTNPEGGEQKPAEAPPQELPGGKEDASGRAGKSLGGKGPNSIFGDDDKPDKGKKNKNKFGRTVAANTVRGLISRTTKPRKSQKQAKNDADKQELQEDNKPSKTPEQKAAEKKAKELRQQSNDVAKSCSNGVHLKSEVQLDIYAFILQWEKSIFHKNFDPFFDQCYSF